MDVKGVMGVSKFSPVHRTVLLLPDRVVLLVVFDALGQAEVSDLNQRLALHQHVTSRQVSVDVVLRAQVVHSL